MSFNKTEWQRNRRREFKNAGLTVRGENMSPERLAELRAKFTDKYYNEKIELMAEGMAEILVDGSGE